MFSLYNRSPINSKVLTHRPFYRHKLQNDKTKAFSSSYLINHCDTIRKFALFPADQPSRSVMVRMIRYQKLLKLFRVCCLIYLPICWRKTILHSKCKKFAQKNEMGKELHNIYETYPQQCLSQLGVSHCSCIYDLIRCIVRCVSSIFQYAELVQRGASENKTAISKKLLVLKPPN